MGKKRVLLAIGSLSGGGAERVVSVWANQLANAGYDVNIFVFIRRDNEYFVSDKVKIYALEDKRGCSDIQLKRKFKHYVALRKILRKIKPEYIISFLDSIQITMFLTTIGMRVHRIETIRVNPWMWFKNLDWKRKQLLFLCFRFSHAIIAQTQSQTAWLSANNRKKAVVIPNPISVVYNTSYKAKYTSHAISFIAAGRIAPQKNYKMMIDSFAETIKQHPNVLLKIFGTGDNEYVQTIQTYIIQKGLDNHIKLMGRSLHIEEEYRKSDVFLMTSNYEGLPNALMEAMASRLICISTDCQTGPQDLIENGINGYLVPVGDVDALISAINKVISMTVQEKERMGTAAREKIMTYCSEENSLNSLCEILNK